jgi:hypothetical protein
MRYRFQMCSQIMSFTWGKCIRCPEAVTRSDFGQQIGTQPHRTYVKYIHGCYVELTKLLNQWSWSATQNADK